MNAVIDVSARTDVGAVRRVNEDSLVARHPLYLVADGMGGHARGDAASQTAAATMARLLPASSTPTPDDVLDAIRSANREVRALSQVGASGEAVAGTTLSGVVAVRIPSTGESGWLVVNVGDSRVYSWDGRALRQLSHDHSAVQDLVDSGMISPAEAAHHPERNVITRALGAADSVEVDTLLVPVIGRQSFLICSDGVTKELPDEQIARILADSPVGALADVLVEAAVLAGARDNVTAIVVESVSGDAEQASLETADRPGEDAFLEDTRPRR